jgi:predicted nucleic acid-binding protein
LSSYYADTSALAKRYIKETGSIWVASWMIPAANNVTLVSALALIEMYSVLARHEREGNITQAARNNLQATFLVHSQREYLMVPLDDQVLTQAQTLVNQYPLRTLDALQLASALYAVQILQEPISFISADKSLLAAASGEGLLVDNPNAHP